MNKTKRCVIVYILASYLFFILLECYEEISCLIFAHEHHLAPHPVFWYWPYILILGVAFLFAPISVSLILSLSLYLLCLFIGNLFHNLLLGSFSVETDSIMTFGSIWCFYIFSIFISWHLVKIYEKIKTKKDSASK
jgi:hypothetical protein